MTIIARKGNYIGCDSAYVKQICGETITVYDRPKMFIHETGKAIICLTGVIPGLNAFNCVLADINQLLLDIVNFPNVTLNAVNLEEYFKDNKEELSENNAFSVLIALPDLSIIIERREKISVEVHLPDDLIAIGSGSLAVLANYHDLNKQKTLHEVLGYAIWNDPECGGELFVFNLNELA